MRYQTQRDDNEALRKEIERPLGQDFYGSTSFVGRTVSDGSYPTTAGSFFAVTPQAVSGEEEEGETVEYADEDYGPVYAAHVGSTVPPEGTAVVVVLVDNRMVFYYG